MSSRATPKIGDVFVIPLPDGRKAYGQYVHRQSPLGTLIRVFRRITAPREPELSVEETDDRELLFPPVFVGLPASLRSGRWRIIGSRPVEHFKFPLFRSTNGDKPGVWHDWRIWDGQNTTYVGSLPARYRHLEIKLVWGDEALEDRIMGGEWARFNDRRV